LFNTANHLSLTSTNALKATFKGWVLLGVLAVWAAMVATMLSWVALYDANVPWKEDWLMVPALVGKEPQLLKWLWAQTMEHRTPLQRAVYLLLLKFSDGDFRIGMITDVLMLGGISLVMLLMARHLRGGETRLADVFFSLTLLHLGHTEQIFLGYNIQFTISVALICTWLIIIVGRCWPLSPKVSVIAGLTLVLLPLSGGNGMIFMPFAALWLAAGTVLYRREINPRWIVLFDSSCIFVSIALVGLYFVGYEHATPPKPGVLPTIVTAARFVGMSLGPVGAGTGRIFPESLIGILFCGVGCLLWSSGIIPVSRGLRSICSAERSRVFGLVMFAAAMGAVVLAMAWGRSGWVPLWGMPDRYALLSVPGLCAVYFAWILYGPEITRNRMATSFAIAVLLALPFNVQKGLGYRDAYVTGMRAFEQDLANGLSWQELGESHREFLMDWDHTSVMKGMQMLYQTGAGPWKGAQR
jgi:hypothetical protein